MKFAAMKLALVGLNLYTKGKSPVEECACIPFEVGAPLPPLKGFMQQAKKETVKTWQIQA